MCSSCSTSGNRIAVSYSSLSSRQGSFVISREGHYRDQNVTVRQLDKGQYSLVLATAARHYAVVAPFPAPVRAVSDAPLVFQYEVRLLEGLSCGGAYVKLLEARTDVEAAGVTSESPYIIMFGPDKCGSTDKVHFIVRWRNPVTSVWEEKHLLNPPATKSDKFSHLYTLIISPDGSYSIKIDGAVARSGSMSTDFLPAIIPPAEIADPSDSKPADWVDAPDMPDPDAVKPTSWDETAPRTVPDDAAVMPAGWLEGEAANIPDPRALRPAGWDEEEDGAWEAPVVPNPACELAPGCGPWVRPPKPNPAYVGPWSPPRIANPAYTGPWTPRRIPNPAHFTDHALGMLHGASVGALAVEVWTMQGGLSFTNFLVSHSLEDAEALAAAWAPRYAEQVAFSTSETSAAELSALKTAAARGPWASKLRFGAAYVWALVRGAPTAVVGVGAAVLTVTLGLLLCGGGASSIAGASGGAEDGEGGGHADAHPRQHAGRVPMLTREQIAELQAQVLGGGAKAAPLLSSSSGDAAPAGGGSRVEGNGGAPQQRALRRVAAGTAARTQAPSDDSEEEGAGDAEGPLSTSSASSAGRRRGAATTAPAPAAAATSAREEKAQPPRDGDDDEDVTTAAAGGDSSEGVAAKARAVRRRPRQA